jgi:drug/metabolite transporter (DMT)-like permease
MWTWYAVVAMICFAAMQLSFRFLSQRGVESAAMLLLVFAFGTVPYLVHVRATRMPLPTGAAAIALLAGTAFLSYVGNLFSVKAVAEASNPGYAIAIVSLQAAVVTLGAAVMFGSSVAWPQMLGIALCAAGVALIVT